MSAGRPAHQPAREPAWSQCTLPTCPALPGPLAHRAFLTVGGLMYFAHATRLALRTAHPLLTPAQHAQNITFLAGMLLLLALLR